MTERIQPARLRPGAWGSKNPAFCELGLWRATVWGVYRFWRDVVGSRGRFYNARLRPFSKTLPAEEIMRVDQGPESRIRSFAFGGAVMSDSRKTTISSLIG